MIAQSHLLDNIANTKFLKLQVSHTIILGLAVFYPLEEFLEKWIPRGTFYEFVRYGGEIILLTLLIWIIITKSIIPGKWKSTPIDLLLIFFLIFSLISTLINDLPINVYILGLRPIVRFITVFYLIVQLGYIEIFARRFAQICLLVAGIVSVIAILQSIIGMPFTNFLLPKDVEVGGELVREGVRQYLASRTRVFSTLGRYDTLGTYLSVIILMITSLYWARIIRKRKYFHYFILCAVPALILSYSRQSWLVTVLGIVILMVLYRKYSYLGALGLFSFLSILITIIFFSSYSYYSSDLVDVSFLNRLLEPFSLRYFEISRYSYGRLFVIVEVSTRILQRAPLFGFGPGNFGTLTTRYLGHDFSSLIDIRPESAYLINDVNWVTILGQVGMIGTLLFGAILIIMIIRSKKIFQFVNDPLMKGYAGALVAILVAFFIMGFFGPNFEVRQVSFFVWSIAGIVFSYRYSKFSPQPSQLEK